MNTTISSILATVATAIALICGSVAAPTTAEEPPKPVADSTPKAPAAPQPEATKPNLPANPFAHRVAAPTLDGATGWINTSAPVELRQLRGKFVMLDFWTYCCINCMHILPELKKLEHAYPNELVVIGIHSAKFDNERDARNITEAVLRYEIEHPVANDSQHAIWNRYGVASWPTMLLIDPEGNVVYGRSGEFTFADVDPILRRAVAYYRAKGTLDDKPLRFALESAKVTDGPLRFPGKVSADSAGRRLFIADGNHNRIVITTLEGRLVDVVGDGAIGTTDGDFAKARFNHPQGMALDGETLYVCDTENHLLRKIDLKKKRVTTIAGTGVQGRNPWLGTSDIGLKLGNLPERFVGKPRTSALNSPWDLWIHDRALYIAMAGPHQIWRMPLDESEIGPYAGNGREDVVDGPLMPGAPYAPGFASFAQPSGLASDGRSLFVADSEGSSIRAVPFDRTAPVTTVAGTAHLAEGRLFAFGDRDGSALVARLQHPLGVAYADGVIFVADTYNNKLKAVLLKSGEVKTIAGSGKPGNTDDPATFDEPAGLSYADGKLYVADTNNHAVRIVDLRSGNRTTTLRIEGLQPPAAPAATSAPAADRARPVAVGPQTVRTFDGAVRLTAEVKLPAGFKINPAAPMSYRVEAVDGGAGPVAAAGLGRTVRLEKPAAKFDISLPVSAPSGESRLRVVLDYYYCQDGNAGVCKQGSVAWTLPLVLADGGAEAARLEIAAD